MKQDRSSLIALSLGPTDVCNTEAVKYSIATMMGLQTETQKTSTTHHLYIIPKLIIHLGLEPTILKTKNDIETAENPIVYFPA